MKAIISFIILVAVIFGGYALLNKKPAATPEPQESTEDTASIPDGTHTVDPNMNGTKQFDTTASVGTWTGTKTLIKDYEDTGTINIKSGFATFDKGILTGGEVVFDMDSIATTSTGRGSDAETNSKQASHMKSADFFDTATYPEAKFVMKSDGGGAGQSYLITGDLTIKGVTNTIEFPVNVDEANGVATITGAVSLDRTLWGIKYGSGKFFPDLGDKVIGDTFTLEFRAVTKI